MPLPGAARVVDAEHASRLSGGRGVEETGESRDQVAPAVALDRALAQVDGEEGAAEGRRLDGHPLGAVHRHGEAAGGTAREDDLGAAPHLVHVEVAAQRRQGRRGVAVGAGSGPRHARPQRVVERAGHVAAADGSRHDEPEGHPEVEIQQAPGEALVPSERLGRGAGEICERGPRAVRVDVEAEGVDVHSEDGALPDAGPYQPVRCRAARRGESDGEEGSALGLADRVGRGRLARGSRARRPLGCPRHCTHRLRRRRLAHGSRARRPLGRPCACRRR